MAANEAADAGSPAIKKLRLVHGAVSLVRAVPSREVSVITVEIPDEHHVQATILAHGQSVLILRSALAAGTKYGVMDVDLGAGSKDPLAFALGQVDTNQEIPTILHAVVAMVRPFPSRMISALYLEVPDVHHIEVTNLLHGRDAILFPVKLPKAPLGILKPGNLPPPVAPSTGLPARSMSTSPRLSGGASSNAPSALLGRRADNVVITRWLATHGATELFQEFLGVRTEAGAKEKVCEICGVESRADIKGNPRAMELFLSKIYGPFDAYRAAQVPAAEDGVERPRREAPTA